MDGAVADRLALQERGNCLQERRAIGRRKHLGRAHDGGQLGIGEGDRAGMAGISASTSVAVKVVLLYALVLI